MPIYSYRISVREWDIEDAGSVKYTEAASHEPYVIATGTVDQSIPMGGVSTASLIYIKSDVEISVKFNSTVTDLAKTISANGELFWKGCSVTAVYITNASGSDATIYFKAVG